MQFYNAIAIYIYNYIRIYILHIMTRMQSMHKLCVCYLEYRSGFLGVEGPLLKVVFPSEL